MTLQHPHGMDAYLELMDRQLVDTHGRMVGKVDDVELEEREDGRLVVSGLLTGPGALGPRLGGGLGAMVTATWSRLSGCPSDQPRRVDFSLVDEIGTVVRLAVSRESSDVEGLDGLETWMRDRVIGAIPGAREDPS